ncbi:TauD/TfdA family dioxygenase [Streptomyces sp. NPDC016566]|uniref:TauD/TfdA family dioxygenase n=1 Tax=Streptomyces sp. NPDC016566 TaxID=3364967 RepID=UPI0036FAE055
MSSPLKTMIEVALRDGWAVGTSTVDEVQRQAQALKLIEAPIRKGAPPVSTLRPKDRTTAIPKSLSAIYGKGAQPLHTDGAHLADPPDLLVLLNERPSGTPTLLWRKAAFSKLPFAAPDYMRHGVFLIRNGRDSFFSTAWENSKFRYDPGCMEPADARARQTVRYFEETAPEWVNEHYWENPGTCLVINNQRVLHARAAATNDPERELKRISFNLRKGAAA